MRRLLCQLLAVSILAPILSRAADFEFEGRQLESKYLGQFQRWLEGDAEETANVDAVLCIGSSSMRGWKTIKQDLAPMQVIHRGFGGSTMAQVVLFQDFFLRYRARRVLVYEGDNDLNNLKLKPETFLSQCLSFCDAVWALCADTEFYFIAIKPSPSRWAKWDHMNAGNALLKRWAAKEPRVHYIDVATPMLNADGVPNPEIFVDDKLHMNAAGYRIWTAVVRKALALDR